MKKVIAMLLVSLLAFCTVAAAAEGIDVTSMSLDELVALHKSIDAELSSRIGCEPDEIPAGLYIGGESIKAGRYSIFTDDEHNGITVAAFENKETYDKALAEHNEAVVPFQNYVSHGDSAFVKVKDGQFLLLSDTGFIKEAKADWMP